MTISQNYAHIILAEIRNQLKSLIPTARMIYAQSIPSHALYMHVPNTNISITIDIAMDSSDICVNYDYVESVETNSYGRIKRKDSIEETIRFSLHDVECIQNMLMWILARYNSVYPEVCCAK